ncbi:hypothetical protein AB210_0164 [Acinetobacter baumannii AB210]|nr:hypothetical protein AB210_0164 [Acinetobacter baumannii AB210]
MNRPKIPDVRSYTYDSPNDESKPTVAIQAA